MRKMLFLLILGSLAARGQQTATNITPVIMNAIGSQHVNIPGTRLFIVPPDSFSIAGSFTGLQKGEVAVINVADLVGVSFYTNTLTFSKSEFEKKGVKVFDYKEIEVDGYPAKFIHMQGGPKVRAYTLAFGDSTFCTMVTATYKIGDPGTADQLLSAINTIAYDRGKKIDPFATAAFTLDDKGSKFKFFRYSGGMYIYSEGGMDHSDDPQAPVAIVMQLPRDSSKTEESIAAAIIAKLQQNDAAKLEIKNISIEMINGYKAYQVTLTGQMNDANSMLYVCVVAVGNYDVVFQGISKNDGEGGIKDFTNLSHTIHLK